MKFSKSTANKKAISFYSYHLNKEREIKYNQRIC